MKYLILFIYAFIFSPIVIYLFYRLKDNINEEVFKKKQSSLVIVLFIVGFMFYLTKTKFNIRNTLQLMQAVTILITFLGFYYARITTKNEKIDIFFKERILFVVMPILIILTGINYLLK